MKITDHTSLFAGKNDLSLTKAEPTSDDANLFANAIGGSDDKFHLQPESSGMIHQATELLNQVNDQKNRIDTSLRRAAKSTDPMAMNRVEGQLSNYYLENMMNTKIVSKAVQSLDKITNLQ